jgi:hypothetical protein
MSTSLKFWTYFSDYCRDIEFNVYNCTRGGTFNMFKRVDYEDVIDAKYSEKISINNE